MPHFGSRVIGEEAHDKALREEKGGANVFGVRVVGAITGNGPMAEAKRATQHGIRVVEGGHYTDTKGEDTDALSIEELQNGLAENPTFFDSWYEGELAREDGPRPEALHIFREVEKGIKGAGRREILDEIAALLGETAQNAAQQADLASAQREQFKQQQQREEENKLLDEAPRLAALAERDRNLSIVKQSRNEGTAAQLHIDAGRQAEQIGEEKGLNLPGSQQGKGTEGASKGAPTKPDSNVRVETQQPGSQILTPKGQGTSSTAGAASGNSSSGSSGSEEEEEENGDDEPTPEELENSTVADLEAYLGDEELQKVKDRKGGRPLKADLLRAAKRKARKAREASQE
jgi:hypothetical protein